VKSLTWSYSALDAFETCPHRYYLTKVTKEIQEPQTQATMWGNQVHRALEHRVTKHVPLPESMAEFEPIAALVVKRAEGGVIKAEQKMALTRDFRPTTWFGKDVYVRGITDFTIQKGDSVFIGDWKTGKPTPQSAQLKLTAAMTFAHQPYINRIVNAFVWLKTGGVTTATFTRDDIPVIWQEFAPRVQRMEQALADNKFPKRPSGLCRKWCPVNTCEHNGKYRGGS
jgi:hypothetical protein